MKYFKYLKYVLRHKYFVMVECFKVGLYWRGIMHDISKFYPSEFIPYARYFYGEYQTSEEIFNNLPDGGFPLSKEVVKRQFDFAWLKHQKRNPHHWQWWLLQNDTDGFVALDMSDVYIKEMICDWIGAGKAITGKREYKEWYEKNKDKMIFSAGTKAKVEFFVSVRR